MPIEAELKARVRDPQAVRAALSQRAEAKPAVYHDTYYDRAADQFMADGRELRLRTVETQDAVRHLLTFKAPAVDQASGSKPEFETEVTDPDAAAAILVGLGYQPALAFTKRCENFSYRHDGYPILATLVAVPELNGTFLEVETVVEQQTLLDVALNTVRAVLNCLGIDEDDLTTELYTDAVKQARTE